MDDEKLDLTASQQTHAKVMRSIAQAMIKTPLVLKGGTALLFGYGLDRFSEDLDFDSPQKMNLESRISHALPIGIALSDINKVKHTDTMTRYMVRYSDGDVAAKLKVEVSYRTPTEDKDIREVDGIRMLSIEKLLDCKLTAAFDGDNVRTKIRDLYDLDFIVNKYEKFISNAQATRLKTFAGDPFELKAKYHDAYEFEELVRSRIPLEDLVLNFCEKVDALGTLAEENLVNSGIHSGTIISIEDGVAVQNNGRSKSRHSLAALSQKITVGEYVNIHYKLGQGHVSSKQEIDLGNSR